MLINQHFFNVLCTLIIVQLIFFWVVGNASVNSVLITDYLPTNQYNGDGLRRVFPFSLVDYSIELTINRDIRERTYSCVINRTIDVETTLFTYIVRSIDLGGISNRTEKARKNETTTIITTTSESETETTTIEPEKIVAHDALTLQQIDELRQKNSKAHSRSKHKKLKVEDDDDDDSLELSAREETSTTR